MNNVVREYSSWIESATASNATATATRAAPAGGISHFVTSISGSYDASASFDLVLKEGSTELARWTVHDSFFASFASPIKFSPGTAVNLELAAGGSGVSGTVVLTGYTI